MAPQKGVTITRLHGDDKPSLRQTALTLIRPKQLHSPEARLVYIHGGAFYFGINPWYRSFCARLAITLNVEVFMVEYPLLPDAVYPQAVHECRAGYMHICEITHSKYPIYLMGDSAGANLALGMLLSLKQSHHRMPKKVALICPWVDLTISDIPDEGSDTLLHSYIRSLVKQYLGPNFETLAHTPLTSPLHGDLSGLPPVMLVTGEHDFLKHQALALATKVQHQGGNVITITGKMMPHDYPIFLPKHYETTRVMTQLAEFFKKKNSLTKV